VAAVMMSAAAMSVPCSASIVLYCSRFPAALHLKHGMGLSLVAGTRRAGGLFSRSFSRSRAEQVLTRLGLCAGQNVHG